MGFGNLIHQLGQLLTQLAKTNNEYITSQETSPLKFNMTCDDPTMGRCDSILHCVTKLKGLKIASLNVNSLLKHIDEIRHLLFKFPFDIFAINESKIDDSITGYYTEGSLDEKSVTRIGSCQGGECLDALAKNFIPARA